MTEGYLLEYYLLISGHTTEENNTPSSRNHLLPRVPKEGVAPHELPYPIHGRMLVLSCEGLVQVTGCCEFVSTTAMSCPEGILGMNSSHALTIIFYLPPFSRISPAAGREWHSSLIKSWRLSRYLVSAFWLVMRLHELPPIANKSFFKQTESSINGYKSMGINMRVRSQFDNISI